MAADAALFLNIDDFGEEVIYTPKDGSDVILSVLFAEATLVVGGQVTTIDNEANIVLAVADVALPGGGDVLERENGEVWRINASSAKSTDGIYWRVRVVRDRLPVLGRR